MMPVLFVFIIGIAVAMVLRHVLATPEQRPVGDPPARMLGWAAGLLAGQRQDWGQAMIGELAHLDGRARRWRFALGCVAGAVVMPPWGRASAALAALIAVAASSGGLVGYVHTHYQLHTDCWTWVAAALLVLVLAGYVLGGGVLLRRRGVAVPGLVGAVIIILAWLAVGGFTFDEWLKPIPQYPWLIVATPIAVGVGGTVATGSAATGRRAARLATVIAALSTYLYGVMAVAVVGATGHDPSDGWTTTQIVADDLANQAVFYLVALPLATATIAWAATAATARLRFTTPAGAVAGTPGADQLPAATPSPAASDARAVPPGHEPAAAACLDEVVPDTSTAVGTARQRRVWTLILISAAAATAAFLAALTFVHTR